MLRNIPLRDQRAKHKQETKGLKVYASGPWSLMCKRKHFQEASLKIGWLPLYTNDFQYAYSAMQQLCLSRIAMTVTEPFPNTDSR